MNFSFQQVVDNLDYGELWPRWSRSYFRHPSKRSRRIDGLLAGRTEHLFLMARVPQGYLRIMSACYMLGAPQQHYDMDRLLDRQLVEAVCPTCLEVARARPEVCAARPGMELHLSDANSVDQLWESLR